MREGGFLFLSGQTPLHPEANVLVSGGIEVQTKQVFANLEMVLAAAGYYSFEDVIKVNVSPTWRTSGHEHDLTLGLH